MGVQEGCIRRERDVGSPTILRLSTSTSGQLGRAGGWKALGRNPPQLDPPGRGSAKRARAVAQTDATPRALLLQWLIIARVWQRLPPAPLLCKKGKEQPGCLRLRARGRRQSQDLLLTANLCRGSKCHGQGGCEAGQGRAEQAGQQAGRRAEHRLPAARQLPPRTMPATVADGGEATPAAGSRNTPRQKGAVFWQNLPGPAVPRCRELPWRML